MAFSNFWLLRYCYHLLHLFIILIVNLPYTSNQSALEYNQNHRMSIDVCAQFEFSRQAQIHRLSSHCTGNISEPNVDEQASKRATKTTSYNPHKHFWMRCFLRILYKTFFHAHCLSLAVILVLLARWLLFRCFFVVATVHSPLSQCHRRHCVNECVLQW